MEYVLNILKNEALILEKCLNDWESKEYPLAKKEREDKINQIYKAIDYIKSIDL